MEPLKVGISGLNFGKKLARSGTKSGAIKIVSCYCRTPDSRQAFADEYECGTDETFIKMVERSDIEAVIIASPNHEHLEQCYLAAQNGKHIFVEKPVANTIEESEEIINLCTKAGVKLAVGHNTRYFGSMDAVREQFRSGVMGQPIACECHFGASNAPGLTPGNWKWSDMTCPAQPLMQMGIHMVDMMRTVFGEPMSVTAHFDNIMVNQSAPDTCAIIIEFDSGAVGTMTNTYIHNDCYSVWHGSEGVLRYMYWPDEGKVEKLDRWGHVNENDHWIEFAKVDSFAYELEGFRDAVHGNTEILVSGDEGLRNVMAVTAAIESARQGRKIYLDEL